MKIAYAVLIVSSLAFLAGCGGKPQTTAKASTALMKGPKTFHLTGNDSMKYNITRLDVMPGDPVTLTMKNIGTLPISAMGHDFVLLKQTADANAFDQAALTHKADGYFPTNLADEVIAHTKLLGPGQSETIHFTAPEKPGEYTYLCTFPGHFQAGMKGIMVVH